MTIISYSEVFKYQTCPRQYYYGFVMGLRSPEQTDPISTGIKGHKLLEVYYIARREGKTKQQAWDITKAKATKMMSENPNTPDFNLIKAWTLVENYIRDTEFTSEAVLVENRFLIPVSALVDDPALSHVEIGFTPDLVTKRKGNFLDVVDFKFVARKWTAKKLDHFTQTKLYQVFLETMGYNISRTYVRFFNVETGKIFNHPYDMELAEKEILIRDFVEGIRGVIKYKEQSTELLSLAPRTQNYTACNFCAFDTPCTIEAKGKDATGTLQSLYVKSDYDYLR